MVPGLGHTQSLPTCGQANKDCNQRRLQTTCGQRWTSAGCVRGSGGVCAGSENRKKQRVYWAYVNDITKVTTAELAPLVMTKLKETLERHILELRKDKCTAYCPTPERVECIREEMTQFLKWTPEGLMILATASDGEYWTEITTEARKSHEPTDKRLRQMCEADLECRRLAPAWKLVTIVLNNALSFDCCVVPT